MNEIVLYKHQIETVSFISTTPYCLNISEAGTGKTFPAILSTKNKSRCLVVCPALLQHNWQSEIKKVLNEHAGIFKTKHPIPTTRIVILSVDAIHKCAALFHDLDILIVDESHYLSHMSARRTKSFHIYMKKFPPKQLIMMTGTPIKNRISELYSPLLAMDYFYKRGFQKAFPTQWAFNLRYCNERKVKIGGREITQWYGSKNIEELKKWLAGKYVKYKLEDLLDLPEVIYEEIVLPVEESVELDKILTEGWENISLGAIPASNFSSAKMQNAISKTGSAIQIIEHLLEAGQGPIVVFSDHREPVIRIGEHFKSPTILGGDSLSARNDIVTKFQEGGIQVLAGTIQAMGVGLTLTRSNVVVFVDKSIEPGNNIQAVRRIQRATQKRKCRVIELVKKGIDQKIIRSLRAKELIIARVIEE